VNKLVSKALALGSEAVFLEVRVDNNAAVSLYSSLGFEQIDVRKKLLSALRDGCLGDETGN